MFPLDKKFRPRVEKRGFLRNVFLDYYRVFLPKI